MNCAERAILLRRVQLYGMKSTSYVSKVYQCTCVYLCVCVCMYAFMHTFEHVCIQSHTCKSSNTHTRMWCVCVLRSLYWVVVVLWQCWVLLRRAWRLRRRGRCWIDTDVCWPWQRCDTPNGFRSAPTHFLSSCLVLIVAWRFTPRARSHSPLIVPWLS